MSIGRVQYTEQQILHATDLIDEQEYRLAAYRRHLVGQHTWGVVSGLRLRPLKVGFLVLPGYAVDGLGRELVVPRAIFSPWITDGQNLFDALGSDPFGKSPCQFVDVWLLYARAVGAAQAGWQVCEDLPARVRDGVRLCLTAVRGVDANGGPPLVDAWNPPRVPPEILGRKPHEDPPDDLEQDWPVYLGRLVWVASHKETPASAEHTRLVGASTASPSQEAAAEDPENPSPEPPPPAPSTRDTACDAHAWQCVAILLDDGNTASACVEHARRPYAGLVGASIVSASRVAVAEAPDNPPAEPQPPVPSTQIVARDADARRRVAVTLADNKGALTEVLRLDTLSGARIRGTARLVDRPGEENPRDTALDLLIVPLGAELTDISIRDPEGLVDALRESDLLIDATTDITSTELARLLNGWLAIPTLPDLTCFDRLPLRSITRALLDPQNRYQQPALARRMLLEDLFPKHIARGAARLEAYGVEFSPPPQSVKAPAPWRVYSVEIDRDGKKVRQLRIEIGTTGDKRHPERNRFMIGRWSAEKNSFESCLTVDEACTLETLGDMMVVGDVIQNPSGIPGALAEEPKLAVEIRKLEKAIVGSAWPYEVYMRNDGTLPINSISVLENVAIGSNFITRTIATIASLPAGKDTTVPITHSVPNQPVLDPAARNVIVTITVQGSDPTSNAVYVSLGKSVPIAVA